MIYLKIGEIIKSKDKFAITAHLSPDGDSIGSMLGLYNALKESGKSVDMFIDDNLPYKYSFLPGFNDIKGIENVEGRYSCLFVLDSGDADRTGRCKELIKVSDTVVNIDHHITNNLFGDLNIVDTNSSSVGEMIYQLLKLNGFEISKNVAMCLYTSILTDTGGFKYSNTTSMTFSIAGDLINTGINFTDIYSKVYDVKTLPQVRLMSKVTSTLEMALDNKLALMSLNKEMLEECNASEEDAGEFVNIARDIDSVEVAVFIKELSNGLCRVSLRSKEYIDVRKIAEKFGGGGHIRAAGCTIKGSMTDVKNHIISEVQKAMEGMQ